jgi:hypothetical protein
MQHEYRHFEELKKKMRLVVCTHNKISKHDLSNEALAYVKRDENAGACYKIYTSEFCSGHSFFMHEIGHILLHHLSFEDINNEQIYDKLMGAWKSFSKYISFTQKDEDRTMFSLIVLLKNYAMDMEVNSKVFDKDEEEFLIEDMNQAEYKRLSYISENRLAGHADAYRRLCRYAYAKRDNPKVTIVTPVFAENYGFSRGLSWQQYIDLIILAPDLVMPKICEKLRNEEGKFIEKTSKIPAEVIKKAAENQDMFIAEALSSGDGKSSKEGYGKTRCFTIRKLGPDVRTFITERAIDKFEDSRTDYLYLANRGKTDNILRGKSIEHSDYTQGNVYIIVDTSGSVRRERLAQLLDLFSEIKNLVGQQSKVIFWDSDLQKIDSLSQGISEIPCGCGTEIAPAIRYTASRFCSENDKIFIISDYYDFLENWLAEIRKLRCSCYGICWTNNRKKVTCLDDEAFNKFCREVETLFVEL